MKVNVLAVDLGTDFGWYDGSAGGNISMKPDTRYMQFLNFMQPLIKNRGYTHIVYERVDRHASLAAAAVYLGLRAILIACAQDSGCRIHAPYNPKQLKFRFTHNGNATKDGMISECIKRGYKPEGDDHADAIALHCVFMEDL